MTSTLQKLKLDPAAFIRHARTRTRAVSPLWDHSATAAVLILASAVASLVYVCCLSPLTLSPDEAHYWDWSRNLDWSYYSKGPLVAWLIRASCEVFAPLSLSLTGDLTAAIRFPAVVCHLAILTGWYILAAGIFRSSALAVAMTCCAITLPLVRAGAVLMTIDPPFMACWSWSLIAVWRALETGRTRWWIGAGILTATGILAKYTMVLFPAAVVGFLLFHRRSEFRKPGVWLLVAGAVIGWLPVVVWNAQHDWVSFRHVFGQVSEGGHKPASLLRFLGGQFGMLFGFWLPAFLLAGWKFRPNRQSEPGIQLLWWVSVPVWLVFVAASLVKSGQPNWPAPAYVGGLLLAVVWTREQLTGHRSRIMLACLALSTMLGLVAIIAIHTPDTFRPLVARLGSQPTATDPYPIRRLDLTARIAGWKHLATEVDAVRDRVRVETGREPILAGTHWTVPGEMGFYCAGHPTVYAIGIANRSDRHSQYDVWRPNPIADAQEFHGQTFVIIGDIGVELVEAFERIEPPTRTVFTSNGVPIAGWAIWVCHGFRGFGRVLPPQAGSHY